MKDAMDETARRREKQQTHNAEHGITPQSVKKAIADIMGKGDVPTDVKIKVKGGVVETIKPEDIAKTIKRLTKDMQDAASDLEFETAAQIRDQIKKLEAMQLGL